MPQTAAGQLGSNLKALPDGRSSLRELLMRSFSQFYKVMAGGFYPLICKSTRRFGGQAGGWLIHCAAGSLVDCWTSGTTSAPGVKVIPGPLTADQWLKWMSKAPSLMWGTLSAIWVTCCALVGAVTVPLLPDAAWLVESSGNYILSSPPGTSLLRCVASYTQPLSARLCSMVVKRGVRTSWN